MSTVTIVSIVVAIVVVGLLVVGMRTVIRRRRLQQRFGPEIRPLTDSARESYADRWAGIQEQFVDTPAEAVAASQVLVVAVMSERGYPAEHHDQVLADLSVEHAGTLDRYRSAEKISERAASGAASTEDLRLAMIDYRALFHDLLGEPDDALSGSAETASARAIEADDATPKNGKAQFAEIQLPAVGEPAAVDGTYAVQARGNGAEVQFGDLGEIISKPGYPQQHLGERCGVDRPRARVAGQQRRGMRRVDQLVGVGVRQRGQPGRVTAESLGGRPGEPEHHQRPEHCCGRVARRA
jgi:hypothetical protein